MKIGTFLVELPLFILAALVVMILLVLLVILDASVKCHRVCSRWIHVYKTCIERERDEVIARKNKLISKRQLMGHVMNHVRVSNVSDPAIVPNSAVIPNAVASIINPSASVVKREHRRSREGKDKKSKRENSKRENSKRENSKRENSKRENSQGEKSNA